MSATSLQYTQKGFEIHTKSGYKWDEMQDLDAQNTIKSGCNLRVIWKGSMGSQIDS